MLLKVNKMYIIKFVVLHKNRSFKNRSSPYIKNVKVLFFFFFFQDINSYLKKTDFCKEKEEFSSTYFYEISKM